MSAEALL